MSDSPPGRLEDSNRMSTDGNFARFQSTPGYIASGPLMDAVNCAIALERPLLLKGEPGTGKTVLARHVADGLGMPMLSWHIKSTSKAADGLYVYDTGDDTARPRTLPERSGAARNMRIVDLSGLRRDRDAAGLRLLGLG
jgi:MoxR-like ATPase